MFISYIKAALAFYGTVLFFFNYFFIVTLNITKLYYYKEVASCFVFTPARYTKYQALSI